MTNINELQQCECEKLDALSVDAYVEHHLDPADESHLLLESSWGVSDVDLTPAIKFSETITHLLLTPSALQYNREDFGREGAENDGIDCIEGDDLSRIISMRYLKDVDQNTPPRGGDVYMYDETTNNFYTFNLQDYMDKTDKRLDDLEERVTDLEADVKNIKQQLDIFDSRIKSIQSQVTNGFEEVNNRITNIENAIARPSYVPADAKLVWGTINDMYYNDPFKRGLYSHDPQNNSIGDQQFA